MNARLQAWLAPTTLIGLTLVAWQAGARSVNSPLFPGPLDVGAAFLDDGATILGELSATLRRALIGFTLGVGLAAPLGVTLGRSESLAPFFEPILDFLATLPPPAVIPLIMLFAGTGDAAKIAIIAYASSVPMLINAFEGAKNRDLIYLKVARASRLTRLETFALIDWPAALPLIVTGARLASGAALLVSITSEMLLATDGVGVYLQRAQENFDIAGGLAGIVSVAVIGALINASLNALERRWLFWRLRGERPTES